MTMPQQQVKNLMLAGDVAGVGVVVATLTSYLPPIAALIAIIWGCLQIYWGIKDRIRKNKNGSH
jgi:hypothetical protein